MSLILQWPLCPFGLFGMAHTGTQVLSVDRPCSCSHAGKHAPSPASLHVLHQLVSVGHPTVWVLPCALGKSGFGKAALQAVYFRNRTTFGVWVWCVHYTHLTTTPWFISTIWCAPGRLSVWSHAHDYGLYGVFALMIAGAILMV